MAVKLEYKINSKVLFLKGLKINDRDVNAAVKCLIWLQGLLPLLMQTTILVFCLKSDLLPKPDNTKIQNIIQNTKKYYFNFAKCKCKRSRLHHIHTS